MAKDKITINGSEYLAHVLKIGSVAQFYKLDDGKLGVAQLKNKQWIMTAVEDKDQQVVISKLFEGFRKQIRTGEYHLPSFVLKRSK